MASPPPPIPETPFRKLTHETTQLLYKELHALLDSMSEMDSDDRRSRLLEYSAGARHRLIRLLVAVRWHMECSAFHSSAKGLSAVASGRSAKLLQTADKLCFVDGTKRNAAAHPSAVAYAAELLGPRMSAFRLPRFIETSVDEVGGQRAVEDPFEEDPYLPPVRQGSRREFTETEPQMRLRLETRCAVRRALPKGINVINWNPDPCGASVRIGIPEVWHADVILNLPNSDDGCFVVVEVTILVRTHMDAGGSIRRKNPIDLEPLPMTTEHCNYLRNMIQDRMQWAAEDTKPPVTKTKSDASLQCLCTIMTREVCSTLVMDYVREQVAVLHVHPVWRAGKLVVHGIGSQEGPLVPVTVEYWKRSSFAASVTVQVPKDDTNVVDTWPDVDGTVHRVVEVVHAPPLPAKGKAVALDLLRVDLQSLCLESARKRAQHILSQLNQSISTKTKVITRTALATHGPGIETILLDIGCSGFGLCLGMSLRTGAFRIRVRGGTSFGLRPRDKKVDRLRRTLWTGERHIPDGLVGIERELLKIIELLLDCLKISSCIRQAAMIDEGLLITWPPGPAAVPETHRAGLVRHTARELIKPPLFAIEPHRPVRFLTTNAWHETKDHSAVASEVPASKRHRTSPVSYTNDIHGLAFVRGKIPKGADGWSVSDAKRIAVSAAVSARWGDLRYATELRFRRDRLLRHLQFEELAVALKPDYELACSDRTPLQMSAAGDLGVQSALLVLAGDDAWRVELILKDSVFNDEGPAHSLGVRFAAANRSLVFSYAKADAIDVRRFGQDVLRARAAAILARGARSTLPTVEAGSMLTILACTPALLAVQGLGTVARVAGFAARSNIPIGKRSPRFTFALSRESPVLARDLSHMMAEVINADQSRAGSNILELLVRAFPVIAAAERAARAAPAVNVSVRTALRLRIDFRVGENRCALEVDGRPAKGYVQLADSRRIYAVARTAGRERNPRTELLAEIPNWENVVQRLVQGKTGRRVHEGAAVIVTHKILENVVSLVVGQGNRGG